MVTIFKQYNPVSGMYEYYITTPACRAQNPCSPSIPACSATRSRTIPSNLPWGKYLTIGDNHPSLAGISRNPKAPKCPCFSFGFPSHKPSVTNLQLFSFQPFVKLYNISTRQNSVSGPPSSPY